MRRHPKAGIQCVPPHVSVYVLPVACNKDSMWPPASTLMGPINLRPSSNTGHLWPSHVPIHVFASHACSGQIQTINDGKKDFYGDVGKGCQIFPQIPLFHHPCLIQLSGLTHPLLLDTPPQTGECKVPDVFWFLWTMESGRYLGSPNLEMLKAWPNPHWIARGYWRSCFKYITQHLLLHLSHIQKWNKNETKKRQKKKKIPFYMHTCTPIISNGLYSCAYILKFHLKITFFLLPQETYILQSH